MTIERYLTRGGQRRAAETTLENTMNHKEERAGAKYATDQIEGDYFMNWVRDQMAEAGRMDPSKVLPLETKADAEVIARNMFQQLEWDVKRDLNESRDFFKGFSEYLDRPEVIDWLADEILHIDEELNISTREAHRRPSPINANERAFHSVQHAHAAAPTQRPSRSAPRRSEPHRHKR